MASRRRSVGLLEPHLVDLSPAPTNGNGNGRPHGRAMLLTRGGYTGARTDRAALKDWVPRLDSADSATVPDLQALRARSRDAVRNQPIASACMGVTVVNAVGAGLYPVPAPDADFLGITEQEAEAWGAMAERLWWAHAGTPSIDITGQFPHGTQQRTALRSQLESGDVFVLRRYVERPGDLFGLRLQTIEADRVSTPTKLQNDPRIVDGVEVDGDGRTVAIHVSDTHPGDYALGRSTPSKWTRVPVYGAETGSRNVIHLFDQLRPGQTRGVPILAAALERMKQLDRGVHGELMAQVVNGMIVYSIETEGGDNVPRPVVQDATELAADQLAGQFRVDYGSVIGLAPGEKLNQHAPNRPGGTFEPFQLHVAREVGASAGVPAGVLLHWFSKSYSASKGEVELFEKHLRVRRDTIGYGYSGTVYGWLIEEAVARRYLDAPGFFDNPLARAAWLGCEWRGAPRISLDPTREANAMEKRLAMRITTVAHETYELTGAGWRENFRQIAVEKRLMEKLGIAPAPAAARPPFPPSPPGDEPDPDDEEDEEGDEE